MKKAALAALATLTTATTATAGGLDRSGQNINILFEEGNYAELSLGYVAPEIVGTDGPAAALVNPALVGRSAGDVGVNFFQGSIGYKQDLNDRLSFALIVDQPYGADINYDSFVPPVGGGSVLLGSTLATLNSSAVTGLLRYKINDRFSVHGGLRLQTVDAAVQLGGAAFAGAFGPQGYQVDLDGDTGIGFQLGAAYEIPDIALRVAVTYFSEIDHDFQTTQVAGGVALPASITPVTTPEAINISFQTGIAKDTLLFGSFRYADYQVVQVRPTGLGGASLTDIDTARDFSIGVGRRFTDKFSGTISFNYSSGGPDNLVSPLAPSNGSRGITIGGRYQVTDQIRLTGGINYTQLGDAIAAPGGNPVTTFTDSDVVGVGLRIGYSF